MDLLDLVCALIARVIMAVINAMIARPVSMGRLVTMSVLSRASCSVTVIAELMELVACYVSPVMK